MQSHQISGSVLTEAVAKLREQPLLELCELRSWCLDLRRKVFDQRALRRIQFRRCHDLHADAKVAALRSAQWGNAATFDCENIASLHTRSNLELNSTIKTINRRRGSEDGIGH